MFQYLHAIIQLKSIKNINESISMTNVEFELSKQLIMMMNLLYGDL